MIVRINQTDIGTGCPTYIVAELSANHNGSLDRALATIRAAAEAGVNAIKLQTYTPDTLTINCSSPEFLVQGDGPWAGRSLYDLYQEAHTPWEWHPRLFGEARACGLDVFSTPFDSAAVELLQGLGAPAYKIASFELVDDELLRLVAGTGKPVILSTGMASLSEIMHAMDVLREAGCDQRVLLRCSSSYPAPDESLHLATLRVLETTFHCPVGLSDHSLGTTAPVVAVTMGASMIEKHLTLSRQDGGVDSHFSLEPVEFRALVHDIRRAEVMIGEARFGPGAAEEGNVAFRRSIYVVRDIRAGEPFTADNVRSIRPGFGLSPRLLPQIMGKRAARAAPRGTALSWDLVAD